MNPASAAINMQHKKCTRQQIACAILNFFVAIILHTILKQHKEVNCVTCAKCTKKHSSIVTWFKSTKTKTIKKEGKKKNIFITWEKKLTEITENKILKKM